METAVDIEENEKMLHEKNNVEVLKSSTETEKVNCKGRKESLRDFLKSIGSITSLTSNVENMHSSKKGILHQCFATFAVLVLSASAGQPIGFSAVLLPQLYVENSTMQIDLEMGSWIASIHSAASPIGSLIAGPMMEHWGRKRTLELCIPPMMIGWICLALSPNISILMVGRFLCGYGVGNLAAVGQVYLGEISDPWLRGSLIGSPFVSYAIGILIVYSLGNYPWRWVAFSNLILPTIAGILLFNMPETPSWLIKHTKITKAHNALKWLREDEVLAKRELHQIVTVVSKERVKQLETQETLLDLIKRPSVYKPLLIINIFNILQTLSGTYLIVFYAVDIINDASGGSLNGLEVATYSAVVRLLFAIIGCYLLLHLTRRSLAIISGIGSTLSSLILASFIMYRSGSEKTSLDFWVTVVSILVYIALNTLGFMMLPSLMVGELLPLKIRGMCGGYIFMIFNILLFSIAKAYPFIKIYCGSHGLFMIFGISSFIATLFLYFVLPETKNKSLLQIESYFQESNSIWKAKSNNNT